MKTYLVALMHREIIKKEREFLRTIQKLYDTKNNLNNQVLSNQKLIVGIVQALNKALEAKDQLTQGHSERVSSMAMMIAKDMGLSLSKCEQIQLAGLFHDVGKIGISDSILLKKGPLNQKEYEEIKLHPIYAVNILEPMDPFGKVLKAVLYHHENWDGTGYPDGLKGENIPLSASIIHVVDSYDAMISERSYRQPMSHKDAIAELRRCSGTYYHPEVVESFCRCYGQLELQETKMA